MKTLKRLLWVLLVVVGGPVAYAVYLSLGLAELFAFIVFFYGLARLFHEVRT